MDTRSAAGKAFPDMQGVFAEFETNLRRERQMEGIAAAKARGVYRGRKLSIDPAEVWRLYTTEKIGATAVARQLGFGRASAYRALDNYEQPNVALSRLTPCCNCGNGLIACRQKVLNGPPKLPLPLSCMVFQSRRSIEPFVWFSDLEQFTAAIMVRPGYFPRLNWNITVN